MAEERELNATTYVIVFTVLVVLTVVTLSVSFLPLSPLFHLVAGLVIGLCKASLVVLFFMHAILSPRLTWCVIAVASFWVGILLVLTLTDYFTRGLIPFTPGH